MDMSDRDLCGLCGQPIDASHSHPKLGSEPARSGRVDYVIIGIHGALAEVQAVHDETDKRRLPTRLLARQLGIDAGSLGGRRFSELVVNDEFGATHSDSRLIPEE